MKNIIKSSLWGIFLVSFLAGCNDFEEINSDPNETANVSASLLCTNNVLSVTGFSGDAAAFIGANTLPKYVGYANLGQSDGQYNLLGRSSFGGMTVLPNVDKMLKYAKENVSTEMANSYEGVAKFVKAWTFFRMTMEMGDIPYSEAGKGAEGISQPKYDSQETILISILDELKDADALFAKGAAFLGDPTPYNGDPDKWRRATNAFALKILMTLSKKEDVASLNVKSRFADIVSEGYLMTSSTGYFGLAYSKLNKHPFSSTSNLFTSRTLLTTVMLDNLKKLNDRRMYYWADPSGEKLVEGKSQSDTAAYVGVDPSIDYSDMNAGWGSNKYSLINNRYLVEDAAEPRMLLTFAEQQLILAEASIRGWITTGTAEDYYKEGVKSALGNVMNVDAKYAHGMPIDQSYIDNYFTGEAAFKATKEDQLKQIWMQRYLLNFLQDADYSYFEYRRTGYPVFPINPATSLNENNRNALPLRYMYPSSETTYNSENLTTALKNQFNGNDEINQVMWLLK